MSQVTNRFKLRESLHTPLRKGATPLLPNLVIIVIVLFLHADWDECLPTEQLTFNGSH